MGNKKDIIKDIFFNEVINEAKNGVVTIKLDDKNINLNIGFNTCIEGNLSSGSFGDAKPILMINNTNDFLTLLSEYVNERDKRKSRFSKYNLKTRIKVYLSYIWNNATYEDFASPMLFIKKQLAFMKEKRLSKIEYRYYNIDKLNNSDIIITNSSGDIENETPYLFRIYITNGNNTYELPSINYGIYNGECYIYSIKQNDSEGLSNYQKKIQSKLAELQEEVDANDFSEITLSLNIFFDILYKNGIEKIKVISLLPVRYNSDEEEFIKQYRNKLDKETKRAELKKLLLEYKLENLKNQRDLSEKLISSFRVLESYFHNCIITSYPMEFDEYMNISINKEKDNSFLENILKSGNYSL